MMTPPSKFLPILAPMPPATSFHVYLDYVEKMYSPQSILIDLRPTALRRNSTSNDINPDDEYERLFANRWLSRLILSGTKAVMLGGLESEKEWGHVLERTSGLLASMSGNSAAGSNTVDYILAIPSYDSLDAILPGIYPVSSGLCLPTPPPTRPSSASPYSILKHQQAQITTSTEDEFRIRIRNTTLTSSSTGFRTWGSAPLLAQLLTSQISEFLPNSSLKANRPKLNLLELGSGTGLVGLALYKIILGSIHFSNYRLWMTDFDEEVLTNLKHNVTLNIPEEGSPVFTIPVVSKLDWRHFCDLKKCEMLQASSKASEARDVLRYERCYDRIFAADVIYEPNHFRYIIATVCSLLKFPEDSQDCPAFYLMLPVRGTHSKENEEVERVLSPNYDFPRNENYFIFASDQHETRWRLAAIEKKVEEGSDNFGGPGDDRKTTFWLFKIVWLTVDH